MTLHVYKARAQPATRYRVSLGATRGIVVRHKPRTPIRCFTCRKRRWAANLVVNVYYDGVYYFCADGKGHRAP